MSMRLTLLCTLLLYLNLSVSCQQQESIGGESWEISKGAIQLNQGIHDQAAQEYWTRLNEILPSNLLNEYISSLRLFSDGPAEELGGMSPLNNLNTKWEIDIDTVDFDLRNTDQDHIRDYVHTVIHEFGHLLTLNAEQVDVTDDEYQNDTKGYLTSEGYASDRSYLGQFVKQFWDYEQLSQWDEIDAISREGRKINRLYDFYLDRESSFITAYAAESPEEDIAESWTFFVMSNEPEPIEERHEKVLFFYQFPELVAYRREIRAQLPIIPVNYIEEYPHRDR